MKKYFNIYLLIILCAAFFISCEEDLLEKEQYEKVIYLLSGDNNIFNYSHALNDSLTRGYLTVGSGGTQPLDKDVVIQIENDRTILDTYNRKMFDIDYNSYAKLLEPSRYVLPSYDIVLHAGDENATTFFPVEIDANELSPDTVYMIPLRVVSTSDYEVNPDKSTVLYKIDLKNNYAEAGNKSYRMKGTKKEGEDGLISAITTTKEMAPISKNKVRIFPENLQYSNKLKDIEDKAILLIVEEDNSVRVKSFRNIQVETIGKNYYSYDKALDTGIFNISYRYKLPGATEWMYIEETLTRVQ